MKSFFLYCLFGAVAIFVAFTPEKKTEPPPVEVQSNDGGILYPWGAATFTSVTQDDTLSLTPWNTVSYYTVSTLAQASRVIAAPETGTRKGSVLYLKLTSDGTARHVLCGAGMVCDTIKGVISKTKVASFVYDGTNFVMTAEEQVN